VEKFSLLIVDDDHRLRELLKKYLTTQGFQVTAVPSSAKAWAAMAEEPCDLMILDEMMPEETGTQFMKKIRSSEEASLRNLPVLMLTAMGEVENRITGLESGVDDYLTKPFEPKELVLRIQTILKRSKLQARESSFINLGEFHFDCQRRCLWKGEENIPLTSTEATLLYVLASPPNSPLSRYDLSERVGEGVSPRTIDVQIARLRRKIEPVPSAPQFIQTVRHTGYILRPQEKLTPKEIIEDKD
jgi:two-component system phosphate regulon response regulator OmpR